LKLFLLVSVLTAVAGLLLVVFSMKDNRTKLILCFGDSLTAGFTHRGSLFTPYAQYIHIEGARAIDFGVPGMMSVQMIDYFDKIMVRNSSL
jgi:hypothetical protein